MEQKTRKIMDIKENGHHFTCVYNAADKVNPYRVFEHKWELGKYGCQEHRKQIAKYADFKSVLCLLASIY